MNSTDAPVWSDPGSYTELAFKKRKNGEYVSDIERVKKLIEASALHFRFQFQAVNSLAKSGAYASTEGYYWLNNYANLTTGLAEYPIHLFPLFNVNQGFIPPQPNRFCGPGHYQLQATGTGPFPGSIDVQWKALQGVLGSGTPASRIEVIQTGEQAQAQYQMVGRKSLVDWSDVKFTFWGKKFEPTRICVSIIRFEDQDFIPEQGADPSVGDPSRVLVRKELDYWQNRCRVLMSNPSASNIMIAGAPAPYTVLHKEYIDINPIDASAQSGGVDDRPHQRCLHLFNRWNRVIDYTVPRTQVLNWSDLNNPTNNSTTRESGFSGVPRIASHNVYVLVESFQPSGTTSVAPPTNENTASFDVCIITSHTGLGTTSTSELPV